jgi:hypothetical protein
MQHYVSGASREIHPAVSFRRLIGPKVGSVSKQDNEERPLRVIRVDLVVPATCPRPCLRQLRAIRIFSHYESRSQLGYRRNSDARGEVARARTELICPTRQISPHSASLDDDGPKNPLRVKFNLRSDFNVIWVVQISREKYFAGPVGQISATSSPRPFPARGAYRDRHERGMGCGGREFVGAQGNRRARSNS